MKTQRKYQAALLALGVALTGVSQAEYLENFIVDGDVVTKGDPLAKFTVQIWNEHPDGGSGVCTGTLIAPKIVLTAAHCVQTQDGRLVPDAGKIRVAFNDFSAERMSFYSESTTADKIIIHGDFLGDDGVRRSNEIDNGVFSFYTNDIAMIRLSKAAPAGFEPLQEFASRAEIDRYAHTLRSAGYGCESMDPKTCPSGRLKSAEVSLHSNNYFYAYVETNYENGQVMMGDSGGPLLIRHSTQGYKLAGVHSFVMTGGQIRTTVANSVRVADYESFIRKAMLRMGADPTEIYGKPAPTSGSRWPQLGAR